MPIRERRGIVPIPPEEGCPHWNTLAPHGTSDKNFGKESPRNHEMMLWLFNQYPRPDRPLQAVANEFELSYSTVSNISCQYRWAERMYMFDMDYCKNSYKTAYRRGARIFDTVSSKLEEAVEEADAVENLPTYRQLFNDGVHRSSLEAMFLEGKIKDIPSVREAFTKIYGILARTLVHVPKGEQAAVLTELAEAEALLDVEIGKNV